MAGKATKSAEELIQAYNQAVSSSFAATDAGMAQTTAAIKTFTEALQTERDEYGKAVEKSVSHARTRGENLAGVMQSMAAMPVSGAPSFTPEAKESVSKLIEGEMDFYQSFTKSWIDYLAEMEARRSAAAQAMLESNVKMIESGQEVMKSAVKYGEACMEWSQETANGMKS